MWVSFCIKKVHDGFKMVSRRGVSEGHGRSEVYIVRLGTEKRGLVNNKGVVEGGFVK